MSRLVYFVGGGRMARAMAQGMVAGGLVEPQQLVVIDHSSACQDWWAEHMPNASIYKSAAEANAAQPATAQDVVILAVKPQHVRSCIDDFRQASPAGWSKSLVVSVAAGIELSSLTLWLGTSRVARVMPNTPAMVGAAASAFTLADGVLPEDGEHLRAILESFGRAVEVPESLMDAVTGVSGSGPAYVFLFIEALADGGVMAGLPRDQALGLAAQTVLGAAKMVLESGEHPGALKDAVASPGGTTIAAIHALEQNAFRGTAISAVMAAARRSAEIREATR